MSSIPKSVFYALNIDNNDDDSYLLIRSVKLIDNSFSFDIWYYITGKSTEILSQENGFLLGIEEEKLFISHPSMEKIIIGEGLVKFESKEWTNIFVSYDNMKLTVALNGIDIYSKEIGKFKLLMSGDIKLGAGFSGYMRSFRIYKRALGQGDYKKYLYQQIYASDMTDLVGFISFNQQSISDLGPNKLGVKVHNACEIINCIHVYNAISENMDGYAKLENSSKLNPGGFCSGKFSIYSKIYLKPTRQNKQVIVSNGNIDENDSIALYLTYVNNNSSKINVKIGENILTLDETFNSYNWVDILVSYDGMKLSAFIDGQLKKELSLNNFIRAKKGDIKIGNSFSEDKKSFPFSGYITTVAIFDKALLDKDAKDFYENHPFIFEDGIKAIFSFDSGAAVELVSSSNLTLTNDGLLIAERTVDTLNQDIYNYRITKVFNEISSMDKWRADTIANAIISYFENSFGLIFQFGSQDNSISEGFRNYILESLRYAPKFGALFSEEILENENSSETLLKASAEGTSILVRRAIGSMNKSQLVNIITAGKVNTQVNISAGGTAMVNGSLTAITTGAAIDSASKAFAITTATLVATLIISKIIEKLKESRKRRPPYDTDDDDKNKQYIVDILELSMQSNPDNFTESAVYCQNHSGAVTPPEWVKGQKNNYGVYIASEIKSIKVKVKFNLTIKSELKVPKKYHVTISGYAKDKELAFFDHLTGSGEFYEGENTIELTTSEIIGKHTDYVYKYKTTFMWNYNVDDREDICIDTIFNIYSLPCTPVAPICLDKSQPKNYIILELIDILAKTPGIPSNKLSEGRGLHSGQLQDLAEDLYKKDALVYSPSEAPYARTVTCGTERFVYYKRTKFIDDYVDFIERGRTNPIQVNCLVYASILMYNYNVYGERDCTIRIITHSNYPAAGMPLNHGLIPARWSAPYEGAFLYHAVVNVPVENMSIIFDASFGKYNIQYKNRDYTPVILPEDNGSYLYEMFVTGTSCNREVIRCVLEE